MKDVNNEWLERKRVQWCHREDCATLAASGKPFVINLDDKNGKGTHWVAARLIGKTLFYADPFGSILNGYPPEELQRLAEKQAINSIAWQRPKSNLCGYYAYRFTKALEKVTERTNQKVFQHLLWESIN
jgi:hypothetical protein